MLYPQAVREKETKNSLYRAVESGNERAVRRMLRGGMFRVAEDPNKPFPKLSYRHHFWTGSDSEDVRPLGVAIDSGHLNIVRLLVEAGADTNYLSWRLTPLKLAARRGRTDIAMYLLEHGADPKDCGALAEASGKGLVEVVEALLKQGTDARGDSPFAEHTPIWHAVSGGSARIVEMLLLCDARVNIGTNGFIPCSLLGLAKSKGQEEIIRLLIEKGAEL
jgi:hypothetical protein